MRSINLLIIFLMSFPGIAAASSPPETPETPETSGNVMNNDKLSSLIKRLDSKAEGKAGYWEFNIEGRDVTVITDEKSDRMRIIVPVIEVESLKQNELTRLMQSNFDSTLDARYAIAKNVVWGAFIHPLSSLTEQEFLSGLGQTVNLSITFRHTYSSGALVFRGGDSKDSQRRKLIDQLLERGRSI